MDVSLNYAFLVVICGRPSPRFPPQQSVRRILHKANFTRPPRPRKQSDEPYKRTDAVTPAKTWLLRNVYIMSSFVVFCTIM